MDKNQIESGKIERHHLFLEKLQKNELQMPNEFTKEMGNLIKKARDEKNLNQSQLADKLSRSQATISDIENGKIEVSTLTLVLFAIELNKPISYFIPEMTFFTNVNDLHNKWEEEALSVFRELEYEGDSNLAVKFMKMLLEHNREEQEPGYGYSEDL
jgi:transcriptional regulator with XRE-family HTH domain